MRSRRTVGGTRRVLTVAAATATLTFSAGAIASAAPTGEGAGPNPQGPSMIAHLDGCAFVFDAASTGGVAADGFTAAWILKVDPAKSPEAGPGGPGCSFRATFDFVSKKGVRQTAQLSGDDRSDNGTRGFVSSKSDDDPIRSETATVTICRPDGACSGPLTSKP